MFEDVIKCFRKKDIYIDINYESLTYLPQVKMIFHLQKLIMMVDQDLRALLLFRAGLAKWAQSRKIRVSFYGQAYLQKPTGFLLKIIY